MPEESRVESFMQILANLWEIMKDFPDIEEELEEILEKATPDFISDLNQINGWCNSMLEAMGFKAMAIDFGMRLEEDEEK